MKNHTTILLLIFITCLSVTGCKDKNDITESNKVLTADDRLQDGIDISASFIQKIEYRKYKYESQYIEQIKLSSLENKEFLTAFLKYLGNRNFDQDQYEQIFFIKLLLVRTQQLDDLRSYNLLSSIFNDKDLSYYLEDYELELFELFLYKPYFFIKGEYKYKENGLNKYINTNLPSAFLTNATYFENNIVEIQFPENALLISKDRLESFKIPALKTQIEEKKQVVEAIFSPSLDTVWQNKTVIYYNIYNYLDQTLTKNLNKNEILLYDKSYKPFFKQYLINGGSDTYSIHDEDGFTNLRKDKNASSEILQKIPSGQQIEVLDDSGDWFLIKTKEGKQGFVHRSRVKSGS